MELPPGLPASPQRARGARCLPRPPGRAAAPARAPASRGVDARPPLPRLRSRKLLPLPRGAAAERLRGGGAGAGLGLAGSSVERKGGGAGPVLRVVAARSWALHVCGHTWNLAPSALGQRRPAGLAVGNVGKGERSSPAGPEPGAAAPGAARGGAGEVECSSRRAGLGRDAPANWDRKRLERTG